MPPEVPRPSATVDIAAGIAATAVGGAVAAYRGVERLPVLGGLLYQARTGLAARGERALEPAKAAVAGIAVQIVDRVRAQLALNELLSTGVDLFGLAKEVVDGIDLEIIISQSTESVTEELKTDVRSRGERADDLVSGFAARLLGRALD